MARGRRRALLIQAGVLIALIGGCAWPPDRGDDQSRPTRRHVWLRVSAERGRVSGSGKPSRCRNPSRDYLLRFARGACRARSLITAIARACGSGARALGSAVLALVVTPLLLDAAGVDLPFEAFGPRHSLLFALATGLANTVKVAAVAIVLATVLGVIVGLGRLAPNPLVRGWATLYVELFRNVPLLIQVFFWYFGILRALPPVRGSLHVGQSSSSAIAASFWLRRLRPPAPCQCCSRFCSAAAILRSPVPRRIAWSAAHSACVRLRGGVRRAGRLLAAGAARVQLCRGRRRHTGIRGARHRAHDLCRGVHRRDRARQRGGRAAGSGGGGARSRSIACADDAARRAAAGAAHHGAPARSRNTWRR